MASAQISPDTGVEPRSAGGPILRDGETVTRRAEGVLLGWQLRTVVIWWLPGLVFVTLGYLEFHSVIVTIALLLFCALLFAFYASDSEVRPRGSRKRYVLTDQRLHIGAADRDVPWRTVELGEVEAVRMEKGMTDRAVARLSGAATMVLEMRDQGPKGQRRHLRIGPMREPDAFREALDARLIRPGATVD